MQRREIKKSKYVATIRSRVSIDLFRVYNLATIERLAVDRPGDRGGKIPPEPEISKESGWIFV